MSDKLETLVQRLVDRAAEFRAKAEQCEATAEALQNAGELLGDDTIREVLQGDETDGDDAGRPARPVSPLLLNHMIEFVRGTRHSFTNKDFKVWLESEMGEVNADAFNAGLKRLEDERLIMVEQRPMGRRPGIYHPLNEKD